ncbi:MAG: IPT/TIG domain-containing protein [Terracidiphilus sp.]|nr:IPT/TIG domain-containing protein [Terracidiphilus sp.]
MPRGFVLFAAASILALVSYAPQADAQALVLSDMSPNLGPPATIVTIKGEKFGAVQGKSSVKFAGIAAPVKLWSDTVIVVAVPTSAPPGSADVLLTIDKVKEEHPGAFAVQAASHLIPSQAKVGDVITVADKGFGAAQGTSTVSFGTTPAKSILLWSDTRIAVKVPDLGAAGNSAQNVTVKVGKVTKPEGAFTLAPDIVAPPVTPAPAPAAPLKATVDPSSGAANVTVKITPPAGSGFGKEQGKRQVFFGDIAVKIADGKWTDKEIDAVVPDEHAAGDIPLPVSIKDGNDTVLFSAGTFTEKALLPIKLDPPAAAAGVTVKITGKGFTNTKGEVVFAGKKAADPKMTWTDTEIDVAAPDLQPGANITVPVVVQDAGGNAIAAEGSFTENPPSVNITPNAGYAGTTVTISGARIPAAQGTNRVRFSDAKHPDGVEGAPSKWDSSVITVQVPDLEPKDEEALTATVVDADKKPVAGTSGTFTERPAKWGDGGEALKFVGGYEQGFQSSQNSSSDAFLAAYGRKLITLHSSADRLGPFYSIRLQTAPSTSGTYNVMSAFNTATGSQFTQDVQKVGSAVNFDLGAEFEFKHQNRPSALTFGVLAGAGFVTPLQANAVNAVFLMPAFGTVECTQLQSRLKTVLGQTQYAGITTNTAAGSTSCFTNNTGVASGSAGTAVTQLEYSVPDQPNFYPKYFLGLRTVERFAGPTGKPLCDKDNPCERGFVDFTLGQDASVSGGSLKHLVFNVDSIYPLKVPNINFLYLFGSVSKRLHNLPSNQSPLVLQAGTVPTSPSPNPAYLVVPMIQPDRDFYRIGIGVSLCKIFTALTNDSVPCQF